MNISYIIVAFIMIGAGFIFGYHMNTINRCQAVILNDIAEHQKFIGQLQQKMPADFLTEMTRGEKK